MIIQQSRFIGQNCQPGSAFVPTVCLRAQLPDCLTLSASGNATTLAPLKSLGLNAESLTRLREQLQTTQDQPYHAGRLMNGKVYLVTQKDRVFYGQPNSLREIPVTQAMRNRCLDEQLRDYTAANGLHLRIQTKNGQRTSSARLNLWGVPLPIPHFRQTPPNTWD